MIDKNKKLIIGSWINTASPIAAEIATLRLLLTLEH